MPPESGRKRGFKIDLKRIAVFADKLLSRDKVIHIPYKSNIYMFHYDTTWGWKHHLKKANDSR